MKSLTNHGMFSAALRLMVGDTKFMIVSNNCWGAHLYQALGMEYYTPFVGLFIPPKSYLLLLRQFDDCIRSDIRFVGESSVPAVNDWRKRKGLSYPIGLLDGCVEVNFQHYADENEARLKWQRRCRRITANPARRFFKFDDRDDATAEDIGEFGDLPLTNKVCFTASSYDVPTVIVPAAPGKTHVSDGLSLAGISRRYFNTLRWLSTMPKWVPLPSLL